MKNLMGVIILWWSWTKMIIKLNLSNDDKELKEMIKNMIIIALSVATGLLWWGYYKALEYTDIMIAGISEMHRAEYQYKQVVDYTDINNLKAYDTVSVDGGKTWYEVNSNKKILGVFDIRHPGLRKKIEDRSKALDALCTYAERNGPIAAATMSADEYKLLKRAGLVQ